MKANLVNYIGGVGPAVPHVEHPTYGRGIALPLDVDTTEAQWKHTGAEAVLEFLKTTAVLASGLAWECIAQVDPVLIRLNKEDADRLNEACLRSTEDMDHRVGLAFLLCDKGPGSDPFIPTGTIWVLEGAVEL